MATYTDNYTMTKPTYAEQADISVINANMDIIDNVMHSSQISLAPAYDLNETYNTGDVVMYELLMYKCLEDNVTGAWDSTKWERTTASETGGGADFDLYGEASGTAEASFSDGAEASLVECEIGIEPQQDLHGYSKPWAGGAGKNKLQYDFDTRTEWAESGYNSGITTHILDNDLTKGATYTFSGYAENGSNSWIRPRMFEYLNGSWVEIEPTSDVVIASGVNTDFSMVIEVPNDGATQYALGVKKGNSATNIDIYFTDFMLEVGSQYTSYEPYSNICPITGHTDVTVTVSSTSGGSGEDTTVSLGRTVYKGSLDVTTGLLTVTHAITDVNTVIANRTTSYSNPIFYGEISGMKVGSQTIIAEAFNGIESKLSAQNFANNSSNGDCTNNSNNTQFFIRADEYTDVPSLKTALGTTKIQYELDTHQNFTLTKEQIVTLLGQNYVRHDGGGTISLVYIKKDSTIIPNPSDAEVPLTGLEISGKGFKITDARIPAPPTTNGAYVLTVTVSGGTPTYSWENA